MRTILLLLALAVPASPVFAAEFDFDSGDFERKLKEMTDETARKLQESLERMKPKEPSRRDKARVQTLYSKLLREGSAMRIISSDETGLGMQGDDGELQMTVVVIEAPEPQPSAGGPTTQLAVIRKHYSHIVAVVKTDTLTRSGESRVDTWNYVVGLDGTLIMASRRTQIAAPGAEVKDMTEPLSPSDRMVRIRWRIAAERMMKLKPRPIQA